MTDDDQSEICARGECDCTVWIGQERIIDGKTLYVTCIFPEGRIGLSDHMRGGGDRLWLNEPDMVCREVPRVKT